MQILNGVCIVTFFNSESLIIDSSYSWKEIFHSNCSIPNTQQHSSITPAYLPNTHLLRFHLSEDLLLQR